MTRAAKVVLAALVTLAALAGIAPSTSTKPYWKPTPLTMTTSTGGTKPPLLCPEIDLATAIQTADSTEVSLT